MKKWVKRLPSWESEINLIAFNTRFSQKEGKYSSKRGGLANMKGHS
jgi:hypothetical protein